MQKTLLAATLAVVIGMGGSASAADIYSGGTSMKDAPVVVEAGWSGFYIGVGAGGGTFVDKLRASADCDGSCSASVDGLGGEGLFGTVQVGIDKQFGRYVAGIFADYDFTDIHSTISLGGDSVKFKLDDMWTAGGRLGYLYNNDTLVYVLAAYSQAKFGLPSGLTGGDRDGWTLGSGIEMRLAGNWFVKSEYRFTELSDATIYDHYGLKVTDRSDIQTARVVLTYKGNLFGADIVPLK